MLKFSFNILSFITSSWQKSWIKLLNFVRYCCILAKLGWKGRFDYVHILYLQGLAEVMKIRARLLLLTQVSFKKLVTSEDSCNACFHSRLYWSKIFQHLAQKRPITEIFMPPNTQQFSLTKTGPTILIIFSKNKWDHLLSGCLSNFVRRHFFHQPEIPHSHFPVPQFPSPKPSAVDLTNYN